MISRSATSSGLRRSRDSTNGRLPCFNCFTRRDTTFTRMLGSWITFWACLRYSSFNLRINWNYGTKRGGRSQPGRLAKEQYISVPFQLFNDKMKTNPFESLAIGWTTTNTREEAHFLAKLLVEQKLVACAQVSAAITSFYTWQGTLQKDEEFRLSLKFPTPNAESILNALREHHSYETPQWAWIKVDGCSPEYLHWASGTDRGIDAHP
jgi:periplasmic divalent cation tolerance protein